LVLFYLYEFSQTIKNIGEAFLSKTNKSVYVVYKNTVV